jgi:hypothetical protein
MSITTILLAACGETAKPPELGGGVVPDYLTAVRDGAFCGWPCNVVWRVSAVP